MTDIDIHSCSYFCTRPGCVLELQTQVVQLRADRDSLRDQVKALQKLVIDAAYTLGKARIWNGMGWTYNPLHPIFYTPMLEKLRNACDLIYAARGKP